MEEKDTKKWQGQRKITEKRDTKTENTFSVLQDKDTETLLEEEEPSLIDKINKDEKKVI